MFLEIFIPNVFKLSESSVIGTKTDMINGVVNSSTVDGNYIHKIIEFSHANTASALQG